MDISKVNFLKTIWFRSSGVKTKIWKKLWIVFEKQWWEQTSINPRQVKNGTEALWKAFFLTIPVPVGDKEVLSTWIFSSPSPVWGEESGVPQVRRDAEGSAQGRLHKQYGSKQCYTGESLPECLIAGVFLGLKTFISIFRAKIVQGSIFWSKMDIYSPPPPGNLYFFPKITAWFSRNIADDKIV